MTSESDRHASTNPAWASRTAVTNIAVPVVDAGYAAFCTRNPLRRGKVEGQDYLVLENTALL